MSNRMRSTLKGMAVAPLVLISSGLVIYYAAFYPQSIPSIPFRFWIFLPIAILFGAVIGWIYADATKTEKTVLPSFFIAYLLPMLLLNGAWYRFFGSPEDKWEEAARSLITMLLSFVFIFIFTWQVKRREQNNKE